MKDSIIMLQAFQDDMLLAALRQLEWKEEGKSCRSWSCQSHIPPAIHTISTDPKPNSHQTHLRATPRAESAHERSRGRTFTGWAEENADMWSDARTLRAKSDRLRFCVQVLNGEQQTVTCYPQCNSAARRNRLRHCVLAPKNPLRPLTGVKMMATALLGPPPRAQKHNRRSSSCGKIITVWWIFFFFFLPRSRFELWIGLLKYGWTPEQARLINIDDSRNGNEPSAGSGVH